MPPVWLLLRFQSKFPRHEFLSIWNRHLLLRSISRHTADGRSPYTSDFLAKPVLSRHFAPMLTLLLLRHAKSSWDDLALDDFDRPLVKRGTKAAALIGSRLVKHALIPDLVICSTAVRTRATLTLVMNEFKEATPNVVYEDALYLADAQTLLERIRAIKGHPAVVMLVGHNPGLHAIALELIRSGPKANLRTLAMQFPTAALAQITFEAENWSRVAPATGELVDFVLPRKLS